MARTTPSPPARRAPRILAPLLLVLAILAALALTVAYWVDAANPVLGGLLALALASAAAGLIFWARGYMPHEVVSGEREPLASAEEWTKLADDVTSRPIGRRLFLAGSLVLFGGALFVALASFMRSIVGRLPARVLWENPWAAGVRLVREDGRAIEAQKVPLDSVMTVFPKGHVGELRGAVILIRVRPELLELPEGQRGWAVGGLVAYSKVCTHAGCPVSLYEDTIHTLACPCHQSTFDVLRGAARTGGPAARPLPQLPLAVDDQGYLIAAQGFTRPIGPGFWSTLT